MDLTNEEKIIEFLLNLKRTNNNNVVRVDRKDIQPLQMEETDFMRLLHELETKHYINLKRKSGQNDLSVFAEIELLPNSLDYFEKKKEHQKAEKRAKRTEVRAWIALVISILAFCASIVSLYLQFFRN